MLKRIWSILALLLVVVLFVPAAPVGIVTAQEMHVLAGRLLGSVSLQFPHKRAGVGRIDDHQSPHALGLLVGQVPGHGAAPVVCHQGRQGAVLIGRLQGNQRGDVLHQMFGPVGTGLHGSARLFESAQVGCHASVAAVPAATLVTWRSLPALPTVAEVEAFLVASDE